MGPKVPPGFVQWVEWKKSIGAPLELTPGLFKEWKRTNNAELLTSKEQDDRVAGKTGYAMDNGVWRWFAQTPPHRLKTVAEYITEAQKEGGGCLKDPKFASLKALEGSTLFDNVVVGSVDDVYYERAHFTRGRAKTVRDQLTLNKKGKVVYKSRSALAKRMRSTQNGEFMVVQKT
jgi:hypothetical protein